MATWFAQNSTVDIDSVNQWNSAADGSGSWLTWASLGATDLLVANAKTAININVSFTCSKISTAANGGTAGGTFICSTNGVTITAAIESGSTDCLTCSHTSGNTVTIVGAITSAGGHGVAMTGTGTLTITGNITGSSTTNARSGLHVTAAATINITGNVTGGNGASRIGAYQASGVGTWTIIGDVTGGSSNTTAYGVEMDTASTLAMTGSFIGGSGAAAFRCDSATAVVTGGNIVNNTGRHAWEGKAAWVPGSGYVRFPTSGAGTVDLVVSSGGGGSANLLRPGLVIS